ncbi:serine/threonine-protein kinase [Nocardia aurantia]|uniref:non-specific serine/threonine protein kinase n=1 Tax=Nocardia aurantia TaxID=2585199 RepID=A0A7K0E0S3_9NOCA|nr:serine/threonine-protein kinase [Nocardia aurantia]MQY30704.1 Serine/threonine-protein kinase PknD [Nocardia aurantia]
MELSELQPGELFAGYRVLRRIGAGGMGVVYLAEHPRLPRRDAVKILDPALGRDEDFRSRFLREAELAARVEHPNVVSIYDRGAEGDLLWIAMRYVDGSDVAELVRRGPAELPPRRALRIVTEAARGLDAAHRAGLLHRDVKPANILVAPGPDGTDTVRITDFGIARSVDTNTVTSTGSVLATFAYASPEQLSGHALDARTDVYSLGCSLFEMLTGAPPFGRRSPVAAMAAHLTEPPPAASAANPALPRRLDAVLIRALAKNPADRFGSCAELAAAATAAFEERHSDSHEGARFGSAATASGLPMRYAGPAGPGFGTPVADRQTGPAPVLRPGTGADRPGTGSSRPGPEAPATSGRAVRYWSIAAAAALVVAAGTAIAVARSGAEQGHPVAITTSAPVPTTRSGTSAPTTPPATTTPAAAAWGAAAYIVSAFPGLLPADPEGSGYQGVRCALNDDRGTWLQCLPPSSSTGFSVNIHCDPNRRPITYSSDVLGRSNIREEHWTRPTGTGSVRWTTDSMAGFGLLDVAFDDPGRRFCIVGASGGTGGQDVYDNWWRGAPL